MPRRARRGSALTAFAARACARAFVQNVRRGRDAVWRLPTMAIAPRSHATRMMCAGKAYRLRPIDVRDWGCARRQQTARRVQLLRALPADRLSQTDMPCDTFGAASSCAVTPVCSAAGDCEGPVVNCEGVSGTVTPTNCCMLNMPNSSDPVGFGGICFFGASGALVAECDDAADCPLGTQCCMNDSGNFNFVGCSPLCPEEAINTTAGVYLVCSSPGGTSSCPGGRACTRTHPGLPDWRFCALP